MCEVEGKIQKVNIFVLPAPVLKFIAPYFADFLLFLHKFQGIFYNTFSILECFTESSQFHLRRMLYWKNTHWLKIIIFKEGSSMFEL